LRGEPGYRLLRAILEIRILLIGSELLGSRVFASLLTSGYGHTTIAARTGAISLSEARNSPVFPRSAVGCSKAEFLAAYAADAQRPQVKVITAERETIEARLAETDLVICAPDIQSVDFLRWLNRACIARQVPWILAGYFQDEGHVGPTFVPGVTACYHCFLQRTLGSVPYHPEYLAMQAALAEQQEVLSGLPAFYDLIAGYLAGEVIRLVQFVPKEFNDLLERRKRARTYPEYAAALGTRYSLPETWGSYVTIGMHPFELTKRRILRLPRCEECGVHSHKEPQLVQWVLPV
jgi:molybdopterin/thiamine biosynthesis adenylyltransferase